MNVLQPPAHSWLSCNPERRFHFCVGMRIDFSNLPPPPQSTTTTTTTLPCVTAHRCSERLFLIALCVCVCVSPQVELTGSSVFDYIHPADHVEMAERLGIRPHLRAEAGCLTTPESVSSSASASSLAGTPEPGAFSSSLQPSSFSTGHRGSGPTFFFFFPYHEVAMLWQK